MTSGPPTHRREVFLFGGTRVEVGGEPARLSPNELALVAIVFAAGSIARPDVVRLLWSEPDSSKARHRVRQLLHRLASKVGPELIGTAEDHLTRGIDVWSDAAEIETSIDEGRLWAAGTRLENGEIDLAFDRLPDEIADWCEAYTARSRRDLRSAALGVWTQESGEENWPVARDAAEALYCLDPDPSESVMRVMEARAHIGKIGASEAAYARYLDLSPPDADPVHQLIERIRLIGNGEPKAASNPSPPFVGRKEQLAAGRVALDSVAAGGFEFVLITGEAGIGKTRLLEELRKDALLKDFRCLSAKSVELEQIIPLNPLLDALKDVDVAAHLEALGPPWDAVVSTALPAFAPEGVSELPPIQESSLTRRLLDGLSMLLESIADERPTILFLDDLHWADATTVTALQFFQRRWAEGQFGVVATARIKEARENEAVSTYLSGREDLPITQIELGELSDSEAAELVEGVLGSSADDRVDRLCQLGGPHPLFLVELARDLLRGGLDLPDTPHGQVPIPLSLRQMLEAKTVDLPESARKVARVLAVMGRRVSIPDLVELTGVGLDECIEAADFMEARGLVRADGRHVVMAHDLFRSTIYGEIGPARLMALHQQVAAHLEASEEDVPEFELATHFLLGGDAARGAALAIQCGSRAWDSGAMAEAARYFEIASTNDPDARTAAEATAYWARALHLHGDVKKAPLALEMASTRLRATGRANQARRVELSLAQAVGDDGAASLGQLNSRLSLIRQEAEAEEDWETVALAYDHELRIRRLFQNEPSDVELIHGLRNVIDAGSEEAQSVAHQALALALTLLDPAGALHHATRAIELTQSVAGGNRLSALNRGIIVLYHQGRLELEESRAWIDEARAIAERSGNVRVQFSIESNLSAGAVDAADYDRGEVLLKRAEKHLHPLGSKTLRLNYLLNAADLQLVRGDFEQASAGFANVLALLDHTAPRYAYDVANAGLGLCALEVGRLSDARQYGDALTAESTWPNDPTTVLVFRSKLLERQGRWQEGVTVLSRGAERARGRMVLTWLRLVQHHARLVKRRTRSDVSELVGPALSTAAALSLVHRERELQQVLDSEP